MLIRSSSFLPKIFFALVLAIAGPTAESGLFSGYINDPFAELAAIVQGWAAKLFITELTDL
jgi:hypothetical protein